MSKQKFFKPIVVLLLILTSITGVFSAPPPPAVPFDDGLFLIIGAGLIIAVKKIFFK